MMVIKMDKPFGMPIWQIKRHSGKSKELIKRPNARGTRKFLAMMMIKVKAMRKTRR
jgi:hypothetical protein